MLQKIKANPYVFRRDIFYRYKCISHNLENTGDFKRIATQQENEKLENIALSVQVMDMSCRKFEKISLSTEDRIFL